MNEPTEEIPVDRTGPVPREAASPVGSPYATPAGPAAPAPGATAPAPHPAAPPRRPEARRRSSAPVVLAALVAGLIGGLGGGVLAQTLQLDSPAPTEETTSVELPEPVPVSAAPDGSVQALSRAVLPSVGLVSVGPDGSIGQGSGFVIREDGYVLTNHHVIRPASVGGAQITVELPGHEPLAAEVVGSDPAYDIAVLKVEQDGLVPLPFADPDAVEVGQTVVAVGAPLGLDSTVTAGIVSALDRPVVAGEDGAVSYINAIQTDAAINPGNSGGPLLDLAGNVVGVNSAIAQMPSSASAPAGSIGLGFAIPAEQAERTATQLIETGTSQHPVMGVHIDLLYTGDGARVLTEGQDGVPPVIPGGPAEAAGVRPGDIIVSVEGTRIRDAQHLLVELRSHMVGDTVEMVLRGADGQERTVHIVLSGAED